MFDDRRKQDFAERLGQQAGWYHSFVLPDGRPIEGYIPLEVLKERWAELGLPSDLKGRRVLDIGAWDGWFSFEAARRGADVVAVDRWENPKFQWLRTELGLPVEYVVADVYALPDLKLGLFDYVFFLGVLYHLRHPLLGLEIVASLTSEAAFIDSFVVDGQVDAAVRAAPYLEFYETDELGNQLDNWYGPTLPAFLALCRAAGFVRVTPLSRRDDHRTLAAHRRWLPVGQPTDPAPASIEAREATNGGVNFRANSDQYVACRFDSVRLIASRREVLVEVGPFAAETLKLVREGSSWLAIVRLPPGLSSGWWDVRLRTQSSAFSLPRAIAVDVPIDVDDLVLNGCRDGSSWQEKQIGRASGRMSIWVTGLAANADRQNVRAWLGDRELSVCFVTPGQPAENRQVNLAIPETVPPGDYTLRVRHGGREAELRDVRLIEGP